MTSLASFALRSVYARIAFNQHRVRDAGDAVDLDPLRTHRLIGKFDRIFCDVDPIIAHALEIGRDLEHRRDLAQLAGYRLLAPDQFDAMGFDAAAQLVDNIVACDDTRSGGGIAAIEGIDGQTNRVADQRAQAHDIEPGSF